MKQSAQDKQAAALNNQCWTVALCFTSTDEPNGSEEEKQRQQKDEELAPCDGDIWRLLKHHQNCFAPVLKQIREPVFQKSGATF